MNVVIFLSRSSMYMHITMYHPMLYITIFFLVVYASGGLCKSSVQAAYRSVCHLLRLVCISGLCQQSHVLALSLLLVVAGDVETKPGPLDGRYMPFICSTAHVRWSWITLDVQCTCMPWLSYLQLFDFGVFVHSKSLC